MKSIFHQSKAEFYSPKGLISGSLLIGKGKISFQPNREEARQEPFSITFEEVKEVRGTFRKLLLIKVEKGIVLHLKDGRSLYFNTSFTSGLKEALDKYLIP